MSEKTQRGPHSPAAKKPSKAAKPGTKSKTVTTAPISEETERGPHSPAAKKTSKTEKRAAQTKAVPLRPH